MLFIILAPEFLVQSSELFLSSSILNSMTSLQGLEAFSDSVCLDTFDAQNYQLAKNKLVEHSYSKCNMQILSTH